MDAYVIIGEPNARKSSVLRSLTGCYRRNVKDIRLSNGKQIRIYARSTSLQEIPKTAQEFIAETNKRGCSSVIFCLRSQANPENSVKYPDASAYLFSFKEAGWNIVKVAVLGTDTASPPYPQQKFFPNSTKDPINQTAKAVRSHFEWI